MDLERAVLVRLPVQRDADIAVRVLGAAGIPARACATEADLVACLDVGAGALLLAEETLGEDLIQALEQYLARQRAWSDLPVLLMARQGADSLQVRGAVQRLGNVTTLERPVRTLTLVSAARSALRARERQYEMRALNRRKDEFLAALAHELRNPLAPIRNATAILERLHPTPRVSAMAAVVDRQVSHLTRLVDDLLDVARITSGKLQLQRAPTTVQRVVTHALEIAQAALAAKDHHVSTRQPDQEVVLMADHVRVVQSLANLLVNAAKFTPPAGSIEMDAQVEGEWVAFTVRDNGCGLDAADLERIFDIFEQSHAVGEPTGGLGLGLHLTRAFAELHGGTVHVTSDGPGRGSAFVLRLPAVVSVEAGPQDRGLVPSSHRTLPRRVLVVDDNLDAAGTLQALLELHGIEVAVAHDGAAAVARAVQVRPDAVVMDIGMPVMNGYEAAQRIRAQAPGAAPVLVALTGWGQYADRQRASQAGFDHHLLKPLDVEQLLECLSGARAGPLERAPEAVG